MNTVTWLVWLSACLIVTGLTTNPLYLLLALLAATLVFLACHGDTQLARAYRLFFVAGFVLWLLYILFSVVTVGGARGRTVLLELPTYTLPALLGGITLGGPITAEDLAWGAVRGMRIWALLTIFGAFNALVNHYRLLRLAPRSFFHAGLAVTIAVSFVPQTVRALGEIFETQRLRGHRFRGPRSYLPLVSPLLAGSLERSIQLAEALDARGYGRTRAVDRHVGKRQIMLILGLLLLTFGIFGWLYYGQNGSVFRIIAALLGLVGVVLFGLSLRALGQLVPRTTYRRERWRRRDTIILLASAAGSIGWIALWLTTNQLRYNPYPIISLPPFEPLAGILIALLATPAIFGQTPSEGRTPHSRPRRVHTRSAEQITQTAPSRHRSHFDQV